METEACSSTKLRYAGAWAYEGSFRVAGCGAGDERFRSSVAGSVAPHPVGLKPILKPNNLFGDEGGDERFS